jgi:hypothetical protein
MHMSGGEGAERAPILRLRFPDGDVELRWMTDRLPVGVLVRSRGALWRVTYSNGDAVTLEPASAEDQAQHGPVTKPAPLGEESIFLETIVEA